MPNILICIVFGDQTVKNSFGEKIGKLRENKFALIHDY